MPTACCWRRRLVAAAVGQPAENLYGNPRFCEPPGRAEPGILALLLQQSRQSGEEPGPAPHRLRDLQQDEYVLPLGERLPERVVPERDLGQPALPDSGPNAA